MKWGSKFDNLFSKKIRELLLVLLDNTPVTKPIFHSNEGPSPYVFYTGNNTFGYPAFHYLNQ